jgi:energy-coupling factor transporter ATP-binding protein EcfA2
MKLTSLDLERFCAFKRVSLAFSPGINVLIGANGTGKSHLMKLLYSILKANEKAEKNDPHSPNSLTTLLAQKLVAVFRPDSMRPEGAPKDELGGLGRLVFRKMGRHSGHVTLASDTGKLKFTLTSLGRLANAGVQAFVATHDYLLSSELSLALEFGHLAAPRSGDLKVAVWLQPTESAARSRRVAPATLAPPGLPCQSSRMSSRSQGSRPLVLKTTW